jgi:hypothetical protein
MQVAMNASAFYGVEAIAAGMLRDQSWGYGAYQAGGHGSNQSHQQLSSTTFSKDTKPI